MKFIFAIFLLVTAIAGGADINSALPVSIWDKTGANSINVTSNALNSFITNSTLAVTQSGTWTTGRTWTLLNTTDSVNVGNFPATFGVTQSTSPWVTNITQFGGVNLSTGTGASGTGIPRVTVSNDSNILATQSGTWTVQPGNTANTTAWLMNVGQFGGTNVSTGTGNGGAGIPRVTVSNDSSITNISGTISLPTGASTSANQTNGTQKTQVVDGSGNVQPSGDVAARKIFTALTDGTNTTAVKAASTAPVAADPAVVVAISPNTTGQQVMASSQPVVLSSNQAGINTFLDKSTSGTITALNATVSLATNGMSSTTFTVTGTWVATLVFEGFDGANWISTPGLTQPAGGITAAIVSNGTVLVNNGGYQQMRIRASAFTSGTATVQINAGAGIGLVEVYNDSGDPLVMKGNGTAGTPDTNVLTVQGITSGTPVIVAGPAADGAAASGNPVRIAGKDGSNNTQDILTDTSGNQAILVKDASANGITSTTQGSKQKLDVSTSGNYSGTPTQTSVSCATTTTTLLAGATVTQFLVIRNATTAAATVWINLTNVAAVAAAPSIDLPPGAEIDFNFSENSFLPTAQINCISGGASAQSVTLLYK